MDYHPRTHTRRIALGLIGGAATTAAAWIAGAGGASAAVPSADASADGGAPVTLTLNGRAAATGSYRFPDEVDTLVPDNGQVRFTFDRNDAAGGVVTGWSGVSVTATSVVVDGTELTHRLGGVEPRDPTGPATDSGRVPVSVTANGARVRGSAAGRL